jgi:squalene-associated FAD-dependent desaturase
VEKRGRNPVIVVGGGLSGLAAAVDLSASGIPVLVLEQKPSLGGRARSFIDATTGDEIDNGQHLLIAGYTNTLAFLDRIGSRHLVDVQKQPLLPFNHPGRGFVELRLPHLPSPLHLLWGVLTTRLLSLPDRLALLRGGTALQFEAPEKADGLTIAGWLALHRQPAEACRCFWEPLAVAIMNEQMDRAPARLFLDALRQAFLRHRSDAALVFPRAGLSRLFADPASAFITQHGGELRCGTDVARIAVADGRVTGVVLKDSTVLPCSAVVLAVPPSRLQTLLPADAIEGLSTMADGPASPIVSMHLWMESGFMNRDAIGLIGRRIQWVFRKERHVSVVISAAHEFVEMSNEDLVGLAVEDLRAVFGAEVETPVHTVVIREKKATFLPLPGEENSRPGPQTQVSNLFLAGDWTNTGLPATIEGAILSGKEAVKQLLLALQL